MILTSLFRHITIEEMASLNDDERGMLLHICNIINPFDMYKPSTDDPYPHSLSFIRTAKRESVENRIKNSINSIKPEYKEIYNSLCQKLSIPVVLEEKNLTVTTGGFAISGSVNLSGSNSLENNVTGSNVTGSNVTGSNQ